jgi:hypothetical protein
MRGPIDFIWKYQAPLIEALLTRAPSSNGFGLLVNCRVDAQFETLKQFENLTSYNVTVFSRMELVRGNVVAAPGKISSKLKKLASAGRISSSNRTQNEVARNAVLLGEDQTTSFISEYVPHAHLPM